MQPVSEVPELQPTGNNQLDISDAKMKQFMMETMPTLDLRQASDNNYFAANRT